MATYQAPCRATFPRATPRRRLLGALAGALAGVLTVMTCGLSTANAQQRTYFVEAGAAGAANSFDKATDLGSAAGGVLRLGLWLPFNLSLEGEGNFSSPKAQAANVGVKVRTLGAAALYNVPVGAASSAYLKVGAGTTTYDGDCPLVSTPGSAICGSSAALLLGGGLRFAVSPSLMLRGEGIYNRNTSKSIKLSNYGVNLGLSLMVGSRPIPDSDHDGVLDNRDACPNTPLGAQVDSRGCTADSDGDGVANGVDRCPGTPVGALVDSLGCPKDSDGDNILDGLDRCPDTKPGVLVDPRGCPRDSDEDGIPDGIDRCSATPKGATVDALGCPGDEDGDGVLDGLDQCPRSPPGAVVDAFGCAAGQDRNRVAVPAPTPDNPAPAPAPTPVPAPRPKRTPEPAPSSAGTISETPSVLQGVSFFAGTARLRQESYVTLDSIATILLADTALQVEIGGHTDNTESPAEARRITNLQAEAVCTYLIQKGVSAQQVTARGYGAAVPLTVDSTPRGRARNRRIEIRRVQSSP